MTGYELSREWFDFAFENTDIVNTNHPALYFWIIEKWNRLGQVEKIGMPTDEAMTVMGIKNWRTYKKTLEDLIEWGFIKMVQESKNQYTANIIAIVKNTRAQQKHGRGTVGALTKALQKHVQRHSRSTVGIIKPTTNNQQPLNTLSEDKETGEGKKENESPPVARRPSLPEQALTNAKCLWSDETKIVWLKLCESKKWKKKELSALEKCAEQLKKYSEDFAKEQMGRAIAGEWQGVEYGGTENDYQKWLKNRNGNIDKRSAAGAVIQSGDRDYGKP